MPDELLDFERPLGPPGDAPRVGELARSREPRSDPADVHLAHAVQLLRCAGSLHSETQQQVTLEAVRDRIAMALKAIAERRLCARYSTPSSTYAELAT
jgi:hypothetical protein